MIALTVYNNVPIQENHYIDNIEAFLTQYIANILSFKFYNNKEFLDDPSTLTLKVELQNGLEDFDYVNTNYARIEDNGMIRYYFVTSIEMVSEFVVKLVLSLDVVNSYQSYVKNTSNFKQVSIKRRHKNRWKLNNVTKNYERQFDKVDEGFGDLPTQVDVTREVNSDDIYLVTKEVTGTVGNSYFSYGSKLLTNVCFNVAAQVKARHYCWTKTSYNTTKYLIIPKSSNTVTKVTIGSNLVSVVADALFIYTSANYVTVIPMHKDGDNYTYLGSHTVGVGEVTKGYLINAEATDEFDVYTTTYTYIAVDSKVHKFSEMQATYYTACDVTTTLRTVQSIDAVNTSDSKIKTIINVPVESLPIYIYFDEDIITPSNKVITSTKNIDISTDNILKNINKVVRTRDINYESKLYGSYVRDHYIAYDTFKLPVQPEYLNDLSNVEINTYVPNDMTTNIMLTCDTIDQTGYKSNVLMCSRNNNMTVFSNDYLEYIRNGYNYDQKTQAMSNVSTWINTGVSMFGTGVGAASALGKNKSTTGLGGIMALNIAQMGVSTATALGSAIMSTIQNDEALRNKRNNVLNSSVNMTGSDNILLFKEVNYGYNTIEYVIEAPRTELLNSIWNLFYFTGYADNLYYDEMPTIKTREYFNYVQADINNCVITNNKIRNRVVAAYAQGITFEWLYNNTWLNSGELYENWETSF